MEVNLKHILPKSCSRPSQTRLGLVTWCFVLLWIQSTWCIQQDSQGPDPDTKYPDSLLVCTAKLNYRFTDPETGSLHLAGGEIGRFGRSSRLESEAGKVIHVQTEDGENHGCTPPVNVPVSGRWIALVQRGGCKFFEKIYNSAVLRNASAVIVYNHKDEDELILMDQFMDDVVSVFIHKKDGDQIADLVDSGLSVYMNITIGHAVQYDIRSMSQTDGELPARPQPLLIISVTLIACLILGLTALLVYGIRRSKYQRKKMARRRVVFTLQDNGQLRQSLLVGDLANVHHGRMLPQDNNNNPTTRIYTPRH